MTKEEKLAFEYGKTFDTSIVPEGWQVCCAFDVRMNSLISEARSRSGHTRNHRNMKAWYDGLASKEGKTNEKDNV